MKVLFVLLFALAGQQFCYGAARLRSFGPLDMRTRRLYSFKGLPDFDDLKKNEKRELYNYEQTIVVRDAGPDSKVRHCQVIEVYEETDSMEVLMDLQFKLKTKLKKVDMDKMMSLMRDCDSVDDLGEDDEEEPDEEPKEKPDSPNSITNGIFPGTKWCGLGDIANGYHDLGKLHNVDRCCRSHDLCPIKVLSKDKRYDITNDAMYTKSHCLCDEAFYNCLKKDNGWTAKFIGNLYFYAASPQCLKGLPENPKEEMKFIDAEKKW